MRHYIEIELPRKKYNDFSYEGQIRTLVKQSIAAKKESENLKYVQVIRAVEVPNHIEMKQMLVIELEAEPMTEDEIYVSRFENYFLV